MMTLIVIFTYLAPFGVDRTYSINMVGQFDDKGPAYRESRVRPRGLASHLQPLLRP